MFANNVYGMYLLAIAFGSSEKYITNVLDKIKNHISDNKTKSLSEGK